MQTGSLPEMAFGRADAPVTIIKYASLTCPYCRRFHKEVFPKLKTEYIDTGKVRFIIREFPIGKTSGAAMIALRCAKPEKYLDLYGKFLEQQPAWVSQEVRLDPIFKVASQVGMTRQQFDACRENQAMIDGLKWVKDRGRTLGVIGTPNFFIGSTLVKKVLTIEEIRTMVEPLLKARATAAAGGSN
jgi:protein-disulfide isomerase